MAGPFSLVAGVAAVLIAVGCSSGSARYAGMNEPSSAVVVRVTAPDGSVTDFWLDAGAAGRLAANGTAVIRAQVTVLAYPGGSPIFSDAWRGDRVRIHETGTVQLETTGSAPDAQLPVTDRCG